MKKAFLILFLLVVPLFAHAQTQEEIQSYHSDIEVFADSSVVVTETIDVTSTGDEIRHGIYRDFPIAYKDKDGKRYLVGFELLEVKKNGESEQYHVEKKGNGLRIYIGQEDVLIPPGEYEYQITYRTNRQLGFFNDHDELYWNVTGNGWVFPIQSASAHVKLPGNISNEQITAALFTGVQNSTAKDGTYKINDDGTMDFATSRALDPYEGLTIVVGWPKGIVTPPTASENFWANVKGNMDYVVGIIGSILILAFYLYIWYKRGRDPKKGVIIAQYESPQGLSPAMLRFIQRMRSDSRNFASAIINMGVKGALKVTEEKGGLFKKLTYTLTKNKDVASNLSEEEKLLAEKFFTGSDSIKLEQKKASEISKIVKSFKASLKKQAANKYFSTNTFAVVIGVVLSFLTILLTVVAAGIVRYSVDSALQVIFYPVLIIFLLIINIIFGRLVRAFTLEGRKLIDEIEGFKLFLSVTEKDRLAFHNPPEQTPELFEKMLPYALALGVEHKWAQQFASVFAKLDNQNQGYAPVWYYGSLTHFSPEDFATTIGKTFTGVVTSSSTPPGSSSGGGGFSGGGGGGGGGGGW